MSIPTLQPQVVDRVFDWITAKLKVTPQDDYASMTRKIRRRFPWLTKLDTARIVRAYLDTERPS